jgi:hypothetical protein
MRRHYPPTSVVLLAVLTALMSGLHLSCKRTRSAAETIEPVKRYFENLPDNRVIAPDLSSIEGASGMLLTWNVREDDSDQYVEYSWVLVRNTEELERTLIVFDTARSWNTEDYIFLPVTTPALQVHEEVGLSVPKSIYDEDGMNRIREIVLEGEIPSGGFVEGFERFME